MNAVAEAPFALHHPAEILALVERVWHERALTTVEFADGHAIVSSVLEVRRGTNVLVFDIAHDAEQNRRLFASRTLGFLTELDRIRIVFETGPASPIVRLDGPAAAVQLPVALVRLQRREWFRAALPMQPPIRCAMLDDHGQTTPAQAIDLSAGGAGLVIDGQAVGRARPGSVHELVLSLPEVGRVEVDATLRTVRPTGSVDGASKVRLGFRFDAIHPRIASRIQKYVQHVEVLQSRALRRTG